MGEQLEEAKTMAQRNYEDLEAEVFQQVADEEEEDKKTMAQHTAGKEISQEAARELLEALHEIQAMTIETHEDILQVRAIAMTAIAKYESCR